MLSKLTKLAYKPDTNVLIHFGRICPLAITQTPVFPDRLPDITLPGKVNYRVMCRFLGSQAPRQRVLCGW